MTTRDLKKKRSPNWSDNEVNVLLDLWKEYRQKLTKTRRSQSLYEEMSVEMAGYCCYRTAEEIRTKIDNMSKRFKFERTQEILKSTPSEWRFYWQVDEILGLNPNFCVEFIKENLTKKEQRAKKEENRATILMFKHHNKKKKAAQVQEATKNHLEDMEQEQSLIFDEPLGTNSQFSDSDVEVILDANDTKGGFLEDLFKEYKETKESLMDTDKKILELLSNQNDLIKTQNQLCQTQNAILKTLLEKME